MLRSNRKKANAASSGACTLRIVCSGASSKDEDYTVSESLLRLKTGVL
jgi:hypothetical protein